MASSQKIGFVGFGCYHESMRVFSFLVMLSILTVSVMSALVFSFFLGSEEDAFNSVIFAGFSTVGVALYGVAMALQPQLRVSTDRKLIAWCVAGFGTVFTGFAAAVILAVRLSTNFGESGYTLWHFALAGLCAFILYDFWFNCRAAFEEIVLSRHRKELAKDPLEDLFVQMENWANRVEQDGERHE